MPNIYDEIASNKRKTVFLIAVFTAVLLGIGWFLGYYNGNSHAGILIAAGISISMTLFGYFQGDKVALSASGAKEIFKKSHFELFTLVENLAIASGLPTPRIYLIDDSSPNAFATGRSPQTASVAMTTGLVERLTKQELQGVLAHEMSHIKNYDVRVMTLIVILVGVVILLSDFLTHNIFYRGRDRDDNHAGILFVVGLVLAILSPLFAQLIKLAVSRSREYLADASGALLTRYPEGLASALEKIAAVDQPLKRANHATAHLFLANPFDPHVTKKFEQLFSTHPPILERVKRLRTM